MGCFTTRCLQEKKTHLLGREERLLRLIEENKAQHVAASLNEQLSNYALVTHEGNLFQLRNPNGTLLFPLGAKDKAWTFSDSVNCQQRESSHCAARWHPGDGDVPRN
jgi:two-component system heavy metal sensor histidine kinase CusS